MTTKRQVTCTYYPHAQVYDVVIKVKDSIVFAKEYPKHALKQIEAQYGKDIRYAHA